LQFSFSRESRYAFLPFELAFHNMVIGLLRTSMPKPL